MNLDPRTFASDPGRVLLSRKRLYILRPDLGNLGIFTCICDSTKGMFVRMYFKVEVF